MIRSLFASHDNGDSVILYLFMRNNDLRIISRWRVVKNYYLVKNNYVSLIFFLNSASACDFPSSINFFFLAHSDQTVWCVFYLSNHYICPAHKEPSEILVLIFAHHSRLWKSHF